MASSPDELADSAKSARNRVTRWYNDTLSQEQRRGLQVTAGAALCALVLHGFRRLKLTHAPAKANIVLKVEGIEVRLCPNGASLRSIFTADRHGQVDDIILGHPNESDYSKDSHNAYFGCIVGRVANRIENGKFEIKGSGDSPARTYTLETNDGGKHALHGGPQHWGRQIWEAREFRHELGPAVRFERMSPAGEAGYPGAVKAIVTYILDGKSNALLVHMDAVCTEPTPINMVQHTYWNLSGHGSVDTKGTLIDKHMLKLDGSCYTPSRDDHIPTGAITPVKGTPFDFTEPCEIGPRIKQMPDGFDHNFVLHTSPSDKDVGSKASLPGGMMYKSPRPIADLYDPESGRGLQVETNAPGVQFYTGNFLEKVPGKNNTIYKKHQGVCLESQTFPNSVNQDGFPSPILSKGQRYHHAMVFRFYNKPAS